MKTTTYLQTKFLTCSLAAVFLGCTAFVSQARAGDDTVVHSEGGISYASGGVGNESLDRLSAIARDFNLKLVFATTSGAYLSDVRVLIADTKGHALLETTADGPWLLAKLPTGEYQITATLAGQEQRRQLTIANAKLTTLDFRWTSQ